MDPYEQRREERRRERERARLEREEQERKEDEERKARRAARQKQLNELLTQPSPGTQELLSSITTTTNTTDAAHPLSSSLTSSLTSSNLGSSYNNDSSDSILGSTNDDGQKAKTAVGETRAGETLDEMKERIRRERARARREEMRRAEEEAERIRQERELKRKERLRRNMEQGLSALAALEKSRSGEVVLSEEKLKMLMDMKGELSEIKNDIDIANRDKAEAIAKNEDLKKRIAELEEALAVYRTVPQHKTALSLTPDAASSRPPAPAAPPAGLAEVGVGERCLVQFSADEFCHRRVKGPAESSPDEVVVVSEDGEENVVSRKKVFPPLPALLARISELAAVEAAVRERHDAMEKAYQSQVAGLKDELAAAKNDLKRLRDFYAVDLRKLQRRDKFGVSDVVRSYGMECDVACYAAEHTDTIDEYTKNDNRWYTANRGRDDLWAPLSDRVDEVTQPPKRLMGRRARLFQLYHDGDVGSLEVYQARALCQRDMSSSRVCIIDTFKEIFVYVGCNAPHQDELDATNAALGMARVFKDGRTRQTPVIVVYEGKEPLRFKAYFSNWVPRKSKEQIAAEKEEEEEKKKADNEEKTQEAQNTSNDDADGTARPIAPALPPEDEDDELGRDYYSYEQLCKPEKLPVGVDRTCLDSYLSDDDFEKVYGMRRSDFVALPEWRQTELRVVHHLY